MSHSKPELDSFAIIYQKNWRDLYHYALNRVKDQALAEDLLHDIFFALLRSNRLHGEEDKIRAYLFKSLQNRIIDCHRKNKLRLNLEDDIPDWYQQHENKIPEITLKRELEEYVAAQIATFPEQMKRVLSLRNNHGLDYDQISKKLLISEKTVRNHLSIASKKLKIAVRQFLARG